MNVNPGDTALSAEELKEAEQIQLNKILTHVSKRR
jgi:hypothetical protein